VAARPHVRTPALTTMAKHDPIARPALVLTGGRAIGLGIAFAIPLVLARVFDQSEFGTYKQLFLIYSTLFGLAQLGMAESLYYFVPRDGSHAGRQVANAMVVLGVVGLGCVAALWTLRDAIVAWFGNAALGAELVPLGWFLAFMLTSTVFEIVLVSRRQHVVAAWAYATSDVVRAICFVVPAVLLWGLHGVMVGAAVFAGVRLVAVLLSLGREFGSELRADGHVLRRQLAYALPFALAVGIEILHINWHQYAVASRFDAASFAIYAVGCLQVPLVDLIVTSTVNVMMVEMAGLRERNVAAARALWHDTISKLAFLIFPLAAFLVLMARAIIVLLFTASYEASVPIFTLWSLTMLGSVLVVDGVLRVFAETRYLLFQNALHLVIVAALAGTFLTLFGLQGAVLVSLLATMAVKVVAVIRISRLMGAGVADALPWRRLATAAACAVVAVAPAYVIVRTTQWPPFAALVVAGVSYGLAYSALYLAFGRPRTPLFANAASAI
jgi:O-antigen/teichoic acid export membrane protein